MLGPARAGNLQFVAERVEDRILDGRVPPGHAANHQPPIQSRKDIERRGVRVVYAAQRSHRQRAYNAAGSPFPETSPR
jgi:hypothetical protein